ncbi:hypothetical protein K435DRAFT_656893, partial [Dendrothele bispora CBS 962.96]
ILQSITWCEDIGAKPMMAVWDGTSLSCFTSMTITEIMTGYFLDGQSDAQGDLQS